MTDKLISDLGAVGAALADNTSTEVQRNGQTTTEQALGSDWKTYIKSWIAKADVGLGNVDNTSDATKNAAAVTLTNKTLTSPIINTPTGIVKGDVGLGNVLNSAQLVAASNLSDVASVGTSRDNLAAAARRFATYVSGRYYFCPDVSPSVGAAQTINTVYCFPFTVYQNVTVSELIIRVATLQAAKNATCAIYANVAATIRPGNILAAGNSIATQFDLGTTSNQNQALTSNAVLVAGTTYWMCFNSNSSTAIVSGISGGFAAAFIGGAVADLWSSGQANTITGVSTPLTYTTTWPDLTSAVWTVVSAPAAGSSSIMPNIGFKVV